MCRRFGSTVALSDASLIVPRGTLQALLGENGAGKSTLVHVAFGELRPDAGQLLMDGRERDLASPADAMAAGLGMVHQHFRLVPAMTVAENVALGRPGRAWRWTRLRRVAEEIHRLGEETGLRVEPDALVGSLGVAAQQRVEIVKALARGARILILDEPTAVLAPSEATELLAWVRRYVDSGGAAVLITHKLREALTAADGVTVLRRGETVLTAPVGAVDEEVLLAAMMGTPQPAGRGTAAERHTGGALAGRSAAGEPSSPVPAAEEPTWEPRGEPTGDRGQGSVGGQGGVGGGGGGEAGELRDGGAHGEGGAGTDPHAWGAPPNKQGTAARPFHPHHPNATRTASASVTAPPPPPPPTPPGQSPPPVLALEAATYREPDGFERLAPTTLHLRAGEIVGVAGVEGSGQQELLRLLAGRLVPTSGRARLPDRIGFVPEDRQRDALALGRSLVENIALRGAGRRRGRMRWRAEATAAAALIAHHDVRGGTPHTPARALSGGNQQKLVLARELDGHPEALIVESPTRGLDVRAGAAVLDRLRGARDRGVAVVVYSSDLDELLALADRMLVAYAGQVLEVEPTRGAVGRAMVGAEG